MEAPTFTIGARATCSDGECGNVIRVVIDPIARTMTHLIIEPTHRQGLGRLVPLELVASSTGDVTLRCSLEEFERLDIAEETDFLPGTMGYPGYDPENVWPLPYFALGAGNTSLPVTHDKLPLGEVAVRRNVPVHATDGVIGKVFGDVKRSPFLSAPSRASGPTFDSVSRRAKYKTCRPLTLQNPTARVRSGLDQWFLRRESCSSLD